MELIWRHFLGWLSLTNTPKVSESKYQAGFGVIISGHKPLTFSIDSGKFLAVTSSLLLGKKFKR